MYFYTMKDYLRFFSILASFLLIGCAAIAEVDVTEEGAQTERAQSLVTKGLIEEKVDTVSADLALQKDPFMTMHDLMIQEKGVFNLTLSRSDAKSIGISDEQYDSFHLYMSRLNKRIQEMKEEK